MVDKEGLVIIDKIDGGFIWIIAINRPKVRNCIDGKTARELAKTFIEFDEDPKSRVAVLYGKEGCFCAGSDLSVVSGVDISNELKPIIVPPNSVKPPSSNQGGIDHNNSGVMGFSRLLLSKPVIAAVAGYAVAGGLELACWCDLRVAEEDAVFGVFCRRWGVPLIDGGTFRLPHLIGLSRAMDMILTGRPVNAKEALEFGLANRVVPKGTSLEHSITLARQLVLYPQHCLQADRLSAYQSFYHHNLRSALTLEYNNGTPTLKEAAQGAKEFIKDKKGRHGSFVNFMPSETSKL